MVDQKEWRGSLHQTFRLFPEASPNLQPFITADGLTRDEVLNRLPYEVSRSPTPGEVPDSKRYRDGRQVYQSVGLLFESNDRRLHVTELGKATARWIGHLTSVNSIVLGRHAAYALTACQLRNPSRAGLVYGPEVQVFPFTLIWRAMLALSGRISSAELNRALFGVTNEEGLSAAIERIKQHRSEGSSEDALGQEAITGAKKNDRIIPWMAAASFGWLLIADKREVGGEWYTIRPQASQLLFEASQMKRIHREYASMQDYVQHISDAACLPKDVR